MNKNIEKLLPEEIERRSFEIITKELGEKIIPAENQSVVKRVIHTSADFGYADSLVFSPGACEKAIEALKSGATIITDTQMVKAGINKGALKELGCEVLCFIGDEDVAAKAKEQGTTRSAVSMEKAGQYSAQRQGNVIFAIGNAPTALIQLREMIDKGEISPKLIIAVPVGFVNVVESKELILETRTPHIVAKGRKGGSNIAAAICNALLYQAVGK